MKLLLMKNFLVYISIAISFIYCDTVYRVPINGTIDLGLPPFIKRTIAEAERSSNLGLKRKDMPFMKKLEQYSSILNEMSGIRKYIASNGL